MHKFLNIKVHQLIFTNPLVRTRRLKLVKNDKQGHSQKSEIIMIYFWLLTHKKVS